MIPTNCPSCGSSLEWSDTRIELFCRNSELCPAQNSKRVENFCKVMKIKGLGESRLADLEIQSIADIYDLCEYDLVELFGEKVGSKLGLEIEQSLNTTLPTLLQALGIPRVGPSAAEKIAQAIKTLDQLPSKYELADVGPATKKSINAWLQGTEFDKILNIKWNIKEEKISNSNKGIVCISGKVPGYTKTSLKTLLEELGYTVKSSLTKDVNILISEGDKTDKYQQAMQRGIPIFTLKQLLSANTGE